MTCGVQLSCGQVLAQLLVIGLTNGAIIALNAISVSLVYSIVRIINFAHGDLFSLTTVIVAAAVVQLGLHGGLSAWLLVAGLSAVVVIAVVFAASLNMAVERIGFRPFRTSSRLAPLMATIGISFMLYQGALFLRTLTNAVIPGEHRSVPGVPELSRIKIADLLPTTDIVQALGIKSALVVQGRDILIVLLAVVLAGLLTWFLQHTRSGRSLRACAHDPVMAQLCGINYNGAVRLVFALGGGLAGVAATVFALYYTAPFTNYGAQSGLIAFTAALLGGIGRPLGALASGLVLGILAAWSDYFLSAQWTPALILAILVVLLVLRGRSQVASETEAGPAPQIISQRARRQSGRSRWWLAGLLLVLIFPLLNQSLDLRLQVTAINILIFVILALGLNVTVGFAGMLDLGYAALFAFGAYVVGLLATSTSGWAAPFRSGDMLLLLLVGAGSAGLLGVLLGLLTGRLHNEYMALVTFALGVIVLRSLLNLASLTNGSSGISGVPSLRIFGFRLSNVTARYYAVLATGLVVTGLCYRMLHSRFGRAWAAVSADETAAASAGVAPGRVKLLAFGISGGIAGIAGALFATSFGYLTPNLAEFRISAIVLIMVVLGGSRRVSGAIIGALLIASYDLVVISRVGDWFDRLRETSGQWFWSAINPRGSNFLAFGVMLYLTVLYRSRRTR